MDLSGHGCVTDDQEAYGRTTVVNVICVLFIIPVKYGY